MHIYYYSVFYACFRFSQNKLYRFLARDAFVRTFVNRRAIAMMFVGLSVCLWQKLGEVPFIAFWDGVNDVFGFAAVG